MERAFDKHAILRALRRLGALAKEAGVSVELNIYGGSAMILAYEVERRTRDVDAIFCPRAEVLEWAHQVAEEQGLPESWLNDDVKGFVAPVERKRGLLLELPGLHVQIPTANYLLAMKTRAAREPMPGYDGDKGDLTFLIRKMEIRSIEGLEETLTRFFGDDAIPPEKREFLESIIEEVWSDV